MTAEHSEKKEKEKEEKLKEKAVNVEKAEEAGNMHGDAVKETQEVKKTATVS